jgi:hypothetical protein
MSTTTTTTSNYKNDVLTVNANFKLALRTTNKAIKLLIASETLSTKQVAIFKGILKDDTNYKKFDAIVRRTKNNMVTPFYVLQALHSICKK